MNPAREKQRLLSFAKAQELLGIDGTRGHKLRRRVFQKERELGKQIAIRGGSDKQPTYRVTFSLLRKYLPELFPSKVDDLERTMRSYLEGIDERIAVRVSAHVAEQVEPRLDELWQRDEIIAKNVKALASRVSRLAGVDCTKVHQSTHD